MVVATETDRGDSVASLVAAGYEVYAVTPMSVKLDSFSHAGCPARARPRSQVSLPRNDAPCASRRMNGFGPMASLPGTDPPARRSSNNSGAWRKRSFASASASSSTSGSGRGSNVTRCEPWLAHLVWGRLHYLAVPTDELWRRIEVRNSAPPRDNEPISRADLDEWQAIFQGPDASELALFDRRQLRAEPMYVGRLAGRIDGLLPPNTEGVTAQITPSACRRPLCVD